MNFLIFSFIPAVISFLVMRREKATVPEGQVDETSLEGNLFWYVLILDILIPIIGPSIFYYGWKKRLPKKAKKANQLGWLAILVWVIGYIALSALL